MAAGKLTPKDWDNPRLAARYGLEMPNRPRRDLFLEFPLQVFPVETVLLPGVGEGALVLPWPPEKPTALAWDYEVLPGRSIGPVRLGMTRAEVEGLGLGPRLEDERFIHFPVPVSGGRWDWSSVGLRAYFEGGACGRIEAWLSVNQSNFRLSGRVLDGMDAAEFAALLDSLGGTVEPSSASVAAPSLGIRAAKWESADSFIGNVEVFPVSY